MQQKLGAIGIEQNTYLDKGDCSNVDMFKFEISDAVA